MSAQRSIVIGGGAFAGLALALALRQGLGADIPVIVADPALAARPSRDPRATAIVAACRRLFEALGVWDQVAPGAADPRHGRHRFQTGRRDPSGVSDLRRRCRAGRAVRAHGREPHLIDALVTRAEAEGIDLRATAVTDSIRAPMASM
jgi:2-octaprenyl-6-methoxyphenol hydroxylase